jgi:hypothetical protein
MQGMVVLVAEDGLERSVPAKGVGEVGDRRGLAQAGSPVDQHELRFPYHEEVTA